MSWALWTEDDSTYMDGRGRRERRHDDEDPGRLNSLRIQVSLHAVLSTIRYCIVE